MINNIVKVHNLNVYPLDDVFKGQKVHIPANGHIEMDFDEAIQFRGQFYQPTYDKGGIQEPSSYKYLQVDEDDLMRIYKQRGNTSGGAGKETFVCHVCTKDFRSKPGLLKHIKLKHLDAMVDDDARDELLDDEELDNEA